MIATLVFAGLRAGEAGWLRWRDLQIEDRRLEVRRSKTIAGLREVRLLPVLRGILVAHRGESSIVGPEDFVFPTRGGTRRDKDNIRAVVLAPVVRRADSILLGREEDPLPRGLSPHKLRHTYASILFACGEDPASVMYQLGHSDPRFTLRVYTHMMRRDQSERARLRALVRGHRSSF